MLDKNMHWKIGEAKQRLSDVVRQAERRPQILCNRDRPVAAVIDAATFDEFQAWRSARNKPSLADAIKELEKICSEEKYTLEVPVRKDRSVPALGRSSRVPR